MPTPTVAERYLAATEQAESASQIIHDFANGDSTSTVNTAAGAIPTLAKFIADQTAAVGDAIDQAIVDAGFDARLDALETTTGTHTSEIGALQTTTGNQGGRITTLEEDVAELQSAPPSAVLLAVLQAVYPVGSPFFSKTDDRNPAVILGFGTWSRESGRVLVGYQSGDSDFGTAGQTGGAKTHTLTENEMPTHTHNIILGFNEGAPPLGSGSVDMRDYAGAPTLMDMTRNVTTQAGGSDPHNNLQPYVVYHWWVRTA